MTITAQNWLDDKYPNKTVGGKIEVYDENVEGVEELTGELLIENYVNAEEINLERRDERKSGRNGKLKGQITKVTIKNCPKLKELKLNNNEIKEIIFEGEFPDLVQIDSIDNKLTEIDISKAPKLEWLAVTRNPITKIKGLEYATQLRNVILIDSPGFNGREYGEWKDAIKDILNVPLTDPLPDTWKTDLTTKLDELENRLTQEKLDEAVENERKKYEKHIAPDKLEEEAEKKGMTSKEKYDKVVEERDARPEIEKEVWENDYSKRPEKAELDNIQAELDKIKGLLGLGSTDNLPTDWQNQLAKKDDLVAAQNGLKEWTDKFDGKTADQVEKENKKAETVDALQKELDDWKNQFSGKSPETVAKEIAEANQNKDKLNDWETKFPDKTSEQVENEIKELNSKPTGTITQEEYDKVVRQRDARPKITLNQYTLISNFIAGQGWDNWQDEVLGTNWEAAIQQADN